MPTASQTLPLPKAAAPPVLLSYQELDILHCLRGFCAFYVVVYHAKYVLWSGGTEYLAALPRAGWHLWQYAAFAADMASSAGYEMVIFFFVLSGFFIRYAQLKKHRSAGKFYLNRLVRIYPPYLASLVLGAAALAFIALYTPPHYILNNIIGRELNTSLVRAWQELQHPGGLGLLRGAAFLKIREFYPGYNAVYWSLLPEALFYLLVPLAFWRVRVYYALSAAAFVVGMVASALHLPSNFLTGYVLDYNGYFALGVGMYDLVTNRPAWLARFRQLPGLGLAVVLVGLFGALILAAALHLRVLSGPLAALLAALSVSTLLAGRVNRQNLLVRGFHEIGIFSFSLYLYHFPLLLLCYAGLVACTGQLVNYPRYYWLALPLVTAGCYGLYYVTERLAVRFFRGI